MFTELMPLIQRRPLTITVAFLGDERIRVNVIPQTTEKDEKAKTQSRNTQSKEVVPIPEKAIDGLTTPLCLTGTPAEIDAELANTLFKFSQQHVSLQQSLDNALGTMAASVKAIEERERIKRDKEKANKKTGAAAKTEEKKPVPEPTLPLLWTTQATNPPSAVSADDAAAGKTESSRVAEGQTEPVNARENEGDSYGDEDEKEEEDQYR